MGAVKALTADGLFIGQSPQFFEFLNQLAAAADAAPAIEVTRETRHSTGRR
jgi:hypothetical protein